MIKRYENVIKNTDNAIEKHFKKFENYIFDDGGTEYTEK